MKKRYQTEAVPTNTLRVGDTIISHGGLFRVIEVKVSQCHDNNGIGGEVHANYCEFIEDAFEGSECSIPKAWRSGQPAERGRPALDNFWNQQGNGLARTARVIGVDHCGDDK